jgi:hypothetical protein
MAGSLGSAFLNSSALPQLPNYISPISFTVCILIAQMLQAGKLLNFVDLG